MAKSRKRKVDEVNIFDHIKEYKKQRDLIMTYREEQYQKLKEEPSLLCCVTNPVEWTFGWHQKSKKYMRCGTCQNLMCEDHVTYARNQYTCHRCLKLFLLFHDLMERDGVN